MKKIGVFLFVLICLVVAFGTNTTLISCSGGSDNKSPEEQENELTQLLDSIDTNLPQETDQEVTSKIVGIVSISSEKENEANIFLREIEPPEIFYQQTLKQAKPDDLCRDANATPGAMAGFAYELTNGTYTLSILAQTGEEMIQERISSENNGSSHLVSLLSSNRYHLKVSSGNLTFASERSDGVSADVSYQMNFAEHNLFDFSSIPTISITNLPTEIRNLSELRWQADPNNKYEMVTVRFTVNNPYDSKLQHSYSVECNLSSDAGNLTGVKNFDTMQHIASETDALYKDFYVQITRKMPTQKGKFLYNLNGASKEGFILLTQSSGTIAGDYVSTSTGGGSGTNSNTTTPSVTPGTSR